MAKLTFNDDNSVTRFDSRDTEDGTEVRLFHKRKLLHRFGEDNITREDWEDALKLFINEARTVEQIEEFLTTEAEEGDEEEETGREVVPTKYRIIYGVEQNCGDDVAVVFTGFVTLPRANRKDIDGGLDYSKFTAVVEQNGLGDKLAEYEHAGLRNGMKRMNIGNILRGRVRRGEYVIIGEREWNKEAKPAPAK